MGEQPERDGQQKPSQQEDEVQIHLHDMEAEADARGGYQPDDPYAINDG